MSHPYSRLRRQPQKRREEPQDPDPCPWCDSEECDGDCLNEPEEQNED